MPEFLYSTLYNEKGHMMGISGRGKKGWRPLQKGLRSYLFCDDCEQLLNDKFEKPFLRDWVSNKKLPDLWRDIESVEVDVDYSAFKLSIYRFSFALA